VLDDADLERAARTAAEARLINSGQSCIAAKRFIVVERVADRFPRAVHDRDARSKVGDPLDPTTQVGRRRGSIYAPISTARCKSR